MLIIIFTSLLAFYLAWNLGANDVANSMGTSVGSKAVTLKQALIIAGVLEFTGAVLFGREVSSTLATGIIEPSLFAQAPQVLLIGMITVLIACGVWLNIATVLSLPVSSSHATVGAIAGFACIAASPRAVDWASIGIISLTWVVTPLISGVVAALLYSTIKHWILDQPNPTAQLQQWIPWLSSALLSVFGVIVLPSFSQPIQTFLSDQLGLIIPPHDISLAIGTIAAVTLTFISWAQLNYEMNAPISPNLPLSEALTSPSPTPSLPTPHSPLPTPTERIMARFQLLSACFVAFAHGSNDVGNAIAPLATISHIQRTGSIPLEDFQVPLWVLVLGGLGIVAGLGLWGKRVIATIGEGIIPLQPSGGFCAELATATTILLASRLGLPVSTSHALVGGVVGIGLIQNARSIQLKTIQSIGLVWLVTIPVAAGLGATLFAISRLFGW